MPVELPEVHERDGRVRFEVRVNPRASRTAITGVHARALRVSLNAPPVDGEANTALVALLARVLSVPKGAVCIVHGDRGRQKTIEVEGTHGDAVRAALQVAIERSTRG